MRQPVNYQNDYDSEGRPAGGYAHGVGIDIRWQNGPLGTGGSRQDPNGAFIEDVLEIVQHRLEYYQESEFHGIHNAIALGHVKAALDALDERTRGRVDRGMEGTHTQ